MSTADANESHTRRDPYYRLPPELKLGPVRLQVADLERSRDYYTGVLGMRPLEERSPSSTVTVMGAADGTALVELRERPAATAVPPGGRLGLYHFALLLPDRQALGRFAHHLGKVEERAGASDHLVSEAFYLNDPDGLGIEVYADRARETWRYQDGQLVMDTRPLDIRSLLLASGGDEWTGMPPGTRVGHLHLHVNDLSRAEAFYRYGLGFQPTVWSFPGALFLSAGGYHHHLGLNTWAAAAPLAGADDARLLEWQLIVPAYSDASAAAENMRKHGFEVTGDDDGYLTRDPWGVCLRIRTEDVRNVWGALPDVESADPTRKTQFE